jgi:outer membrane murein-binding lipoprotein Lpp
MNRMLVGITLLAALITAGCASRAYDPFRIPADEFRQRVKTIAVASVAISSELGDRAAVQAKFNPAIETKLREAGFTVVAAQEFQATWDAKVNELGGLFDQNTGKVNDAKATALLNHIRAETKTRFNADALLLPRGTAVTARFSYTPFVGVRAAWDGASEALETGAFDKVISPRGNGSVDALSLVLRIEDLNGSALYVHAGGIQALSKLSPGAGNFGGSSFVQVPKDQLLTDDARMQQAVQYALAPFFTREP